MIISHRHGFVFVHVNKVAGSSLTDSLAAVCGPKDIIGRMSGAEAGRSQNNEIPIPKMTLRSLGSWAKRRRRPMVASHTRATQARRLIGPDLWDRYFTFAIERNPWDKAVSRYFWDRYRHLDEDPGFSTFLREVPKWKLTTFGLYSARGKIIVDEVLRYESLAQELGRVWDRLGIFPPDPSLKLGGTRPEWARDYRVMYGDGDAEFIARVCSREIAAFGYRF